jgi:hypothetical protein
MENDFYRVERSEAAAVPHSRIDRIEKCTDLTVGLRGALGGNSDFAVLGIEQPV